MDDFEVRAQSSSILYSSEIVDRLTEQAADYRSFPVIINGEAHTFHDVRGGYDEDAAQHLVKLVQRHDNMAQEPRETRAAVYEVQLDDSFLLYADDYHSFENESELVLCLGVTDYDMQ